MHAYIHYNSNPSNIFVFMDTDKFISQFMWKPKASRKTKMIWSEKNIISGAEDIAQHCMARQDPEFDCRYYIYRESPNLIPGTNKKCLWYWISRKYEETLDHYTTHACVCTHALQIFVEMNAN